MRAYFIGFVGLLSSGAFAQVVVPNAFANAYGNTFNYILNDSSYGSTARQYDMIIPASQLTGLINQDISSIQLRPEFSNPGLGASIFRISLDGNVVRSGALSLPAFTYTEFAWTPEITFDQNYHYSGGEMHFQIYNNATGGGDSRVFDSNLDGSSGITASFTSYFAASGPSTVTGMSALVVKFNTVPEPASVAVLGLGVLALLRRRQK